MSDVASRCGYCGQPEGHSARCAVTRLGAAEIRVLGGEHRTSDAGRCTCGLQVDGIITTCEVHPRPETAVPPDVMQLAADQEVARREERQRIVWWLTGTAEGIEATMGKTQYSDALRDAVTGIRAELHLAPPDVKGGST